MTIQFNKPPRVESSGEYLLDALRRGKYSGDGYYTKKCSAWIAGAVGSCDVLMTTSGSHALDMAARLCGVGQGDEVIMPSYTFSSTANAFVGLGAEIVFVDIRPDTMNLDEALVEAAVTPKTKAVVPVHYAGVACDMDAICEIAERHDLMVVEDAAQALMSSYKGKPCGGLSNFGCFSFHETKNFTMGEGGALVVRDKAARECAEIIREKGTDRSKFFRGEVDKYSWVDWGSSYLPSEFLCAHLWSQLEVAAEITADRLRSWNLYYDLLGDLGPQGAGRMELPAIPEECAHNGHMFWIKVGGLDERTRLIDYLKNNGVNSVFHYVPLHSAPAGRKYGRFFGEDRYTTNESERLLRLPMYYGLKPEEIEYIAEVLHRF
jgi:dTDP-4-amino-4,6-dideoxygalactose transaminase